MYFDIDDVKFMSSFFPNKSSQKDLQIAKAKNNTYRFAVIPTTLQIQLCDDVAKTKTIA